MKQQLLIRLCGLSLLLGAGCVRDNYAGDYNQYCHNSSTGVFVEVKDYLTGQALPEQRFELLYSTTFSTSLGGMAAVVEQKEVWTSNTEGLIDEHFGQDANYQSLYDLRLLSDSTYYATQWWGVPKGCDHRYTVFLKKALDLPVTFRNESGFEIINFSLESRTLPGFNPDIKGVARPLTHTWLQPPVATLAAGTEQTLLVRALPDERVVLARRFGRNGLPVAINDTLNVGSVATPLTIVIR